MAIALFRPSRRLTRAAETEHLLQASSLPADIQDLLRQVIARTRLHRHEKLDVARELIVHFQDGLERQTKEQIMSDFGDPRNAAQLIRRAKIRNRPLSARLALRTAPLLALGAVLCVLSVARGQMVDYLAKVNEPALAVPEQDQAWPIYRAAMIKADFTKLDTSPLYTGPQNHQRLIRPGDEGWAQAKAFFVAHQNLLDAIRAGGVKPGLGLTVGHAGYYTGEDRLALYGPDREQPAPTGFWDHTLVGVMLPHLGLMRKMTRMLMVDSRAALDDADVLRYLDDMRALAGLARQSQELPTLFGELVGVSIMDKLVRETGDALEHHPAALSSVQWQKLADVIRSLNDLNSTDFAGERFFVEDILQRLFGPDGQLSAEGRQALLHSGEVFENVQVTAEQLDHVAPLPEQRAALEQFMSLAESDAQRPLDELLRRDPQADVFARNLDAQRLLPLHLLLPNVSATQRSLISNFTARQALLVAIAAERYRTDHGDYPSSAEQLVPKYLPKVPRDESVDEGSLLLKVRDGQLTVYGRGIDGDDDGGVPPQDYAWPLYADQTDGDWVLYPVLQDD